MAQFLHAMTVDAFPVTFGPTALIRGSVTTDL
jgi:hypothetical protein